MNILQEIFAYYRLGFRKMFDFSTPSARKELNYFVLSYSVVWLVFLIINILGISMLSMVIPRGLLNFTFLSGMLCLIFNVLHIVPLFSLMRRRLNDICPEKSRLLFLGLVLVYLVQISVPILILLNNNLIIQSPERVLIFFPYFIFSVICGWIVMGMLIFLMCKKGKLTKAPLDNDMQ